MIRRDARRTRAARMLRTGGRVTLTIGIVALSGAGVVAGQAMLSERLSAEKGPAPAPATAVATSRLVLRTAYDVTRRFAGQFEARQDAALGFEEGGTVTAILVDEGDRVAEGQAVARLDTRLLEAERARLIATRAAAQARAELARRTDARQAELLERGFATTQTADDASLGLIGLEARVAEIDAAIAALDLRLSKAVIRAPFAGTIGARFGDVGSVARPGAPVATLIEDGPVLFRAGLDPALADGLAPGEAVTIETGGRRMEATLERLAPGLEAATRARVAFFAVEGDAPPARAAGEVVLSSRIAAPRPGAWLPLAALRQGPRGTWQILTVEAGASGPVAGLESVEILHAEGDRAFVAGTIADGMAYIPAGPHRVVPGERLRTGGTDVASWDH